MADNGTGPDFTQALGNFGSLYKVEHAGRTWQLEFITDKAKSEIEIFAKQHALASLRQQFADGVITSEEEYRADRAHVLNEIAQKKFVFWSERVFSVLNTAEGQVAFAMALLRGKQPEVTAEDVTAILADDKSAGQLGDALLAIQTEVAARAGKLKAQAAALAAKKTPTPT